MDRQTRDVIAHPNRGKCTLVYRNGPSLLVLGDGSQVTLSRHPSIGYRSKEGAYARILDPVHGEIEVRVLKSGEVHKRRTHSLLGGGWLVFESEGFWLRFEADGGQRVRFQWSEIHVGTPDYARRSKRRRSQIEPITPEEEMWDTYTTKEGEVWAFRKEGEVASLKLDSPKPSKPVKQGE